MNVPFRRRAALALAVTSLLFVTGCDIDDLTADPPADATDLTEAIAELTVAEEHRDGYDREKFSDWVTENGCNTRQLVLIEEDVSGQASEADCSGTIKGEWLSVYDGETVTDPSKVDIDHMVPLAEAWDSGAWEWTPEKRAEYATFLDDPRHLVAVTAGSNRSKSDQDPAEWLPPDEDALCGYIADWVAIKLDWDLSVDEAEHDALVEAARGCDGTTLA